METQLWKYLLALFAQRGGLMNGTLLDSGANDGFSTWQLAKRFPHHRILSVEPIATNVDEIYKKKAWGLPRSGLTTRHAWRLPNVQIVHGGLGATLGFGSYPAKLDDQKGSGTVQTGLLSLYDHQAQIRYRRLYPIYTLDSLIQPHRYMHERLVFAHIDVEGAEPEVLHGGEQTIMHDRPILTVETFPKSNATRHRILMDRLRFLYYTCHMLDEPCGWGDCRNLVCVPM